jgi:hypothetical protein
MGDEDINNDLFPNEADAGEAESLWKGGQDQAERGKPEGKFQVRIKKAALGRSNSSGRMQIHYQLEVVSGDSIGIMLNKYDGMGAVKQVAMTQEQLRRLGVDVKSLSIQQLPAALTTLIDRVVNVTGKVNGDFHNIYFNSMVDTEVGADGSSSSKPDIF